MNVDKNITSVNLTNDVLKKVGLYEKIHENPNDIFNDVTKEFSPNGILFLEEKCSA